MKKLSASLVLLVSSLSLGQSAANLVQQTDTRLQTGSGLTAANLTAASAGNPDEKQVPDLQDEVKRYQEPPNQDGCPVKLTNASITPYLMLLRTESGDPSTQSGIDLGFRNNSGKEIQSFELDAVFLARKTIYDLRATRINLRLTASGTKALDKTFDHLRHLRIPERTHPVMLSEVHLEQVTFADGSVWSPERDSSCSFSPNGAVQIGAR